jgi:hypothetical protein
VPLSSARDSLVHSQGKTDGLLDEVPMPCDIFKALIDGGIEILFSALRADPRRDAFNIDGVPFEMKPGAYPPKFQRPFTKFARLTFPHPTHLSSFRDIGCNNQEDARK